jgi:hypothetical protein
MTTQTFSGIQIEHDPDEAELHRLGVKNWPIWTQEVSTFPWIYGEAETCYVPEGEVLVTPDGGEAVRIQPGDLVTFPAGMSRTWDIRKDMRKHYRFGWYFPYVSGLSEFVFPFIFDINHIFAALDVKQVRRLE